MKKIVVLAILATAIFCSCSKEEQRPGGEPQQVVFAVTGIEATRAAHNYSFDKYVGLISEVTVVYGGTPYTYKYEAGEDVLTALTPWDMIRFPKDDSPMGLVTLRWPESSVAGEDKVDRDQSLLADFLRMDRLEGSVSNVIPTTVIPIALHHVRSKITFTLGGTMTGKRITQLSIGDFKAYCDPAIDDAQLIYDQTADAGSLPEATVIHFQIEGETETYIFALNDSPDDVLQSKAGNYTVTIDFL